MKKGLPDKSRVAAVSLMRKTAMMGAAATALIAAAPAFAAAPGTEPSLQATIRNILRTPAKEMSWRATSAPTSAAQARSSAIDVGNGDDISVGADESAISHAESVEDVSLVNTGNLTGGIGIEVSTGAVNTVDPINDELTIYSTPGNREPLYDDAGNPVYDGNYQAWASTANFTYHTRATTLAPDPLASRIAIDNRGSIDFSGQGGIRATNPFGESISISNSGDITSTQDTTERAGIYASTKWPPQTSYDVQTVPGEVTRNAYGQLTGVITPDEITIDRDIVDMAYDAGAIDIHNTGDIDMGAAAPLPYGGFAASGIFARGDGGTTILNEGHITVGKWSAGIQVSSTAATSITNAGRIDLGNAAAGVVFGPSDGSAGDYRLGGDVYILNTGDIVGGITKAQADTGETTFVSGLNVTSLGSNNEFYAAGAHVNAVYAEYNALLGSDVYPIFNFPKLHLYDTTVVNQGHIELKDGGVGISILPISGNSTAINSGTIIVGDGISVALNNARLPSAGIFQTNFPYESLGSTTSINTETGVIVTGDDSSGIENHSFAGDSIVINEGSITVGNGVSTLITNYAGATFDRLFQARGIASVSGAPMFGTLGYARNSGEITVGNLAFGSTVSGHGFSLLDPARVTALNVNEGIITTGDNSTGMFAWGTNATSYNTGRITTGDYDISAFHPHPEYTADEFAQLRFGAASSAAVLAKVINNGTIITGDGKVGVSAYLSRTGYGVAASVIQNDAGIITTGDHSIGAQVAGTHYSFFSNDGKISTGDDSVGADVAAGAVFLRYGQTTATVIEGALDASNGGIIETGDNSIGVRMLGSRQDVAYAGRVRLPDPDTPYYYYYLDVAGTAALNNAAYFHNSGTIRVGAHSTGVEFSGTAANEQGLHLFNSGIIDASKAGSTALRLNTDYDIDTYAVNVGTIAGNITFGAGDDRLVNTLMVENGRVTHSGNIVMHGSTIDFGAGANTFDNDRGMITIAGGENLITGADVVMTQASIEARNNAVDGSLTINGNVSGDFTFGTDFNATGADQLIITGDVAEGSSMSVVINSTEQLSGAHSFKVITVDGENHAGAPVLAGITGNFADSVLDADVSYSETTGEVTVTANFGMGHMATSAASATTMAQNWWMQSTGSLDKRDMQQLAGLEDTGLSVWATAFNEEATVDPRNDLQSVSFDQKVSGLQTGIEWKRDIGGGSFNIGPMFSFGNASAAQNANLASASGDAAAFGLNAGYRFGNGLYLNATWQRMTMDIDFRTPGTLSHAVGSTEAEGNGFNLELGYAHKLGSGLTLAPQLQYARVSVDVDDFTSSDDVYVFSQMGGKHSLLRAGVSVFKTFETTHGCITPLADLSYLDAMDGDSTLASNGVMFGNDTSGSGYRAELGVAGRYKDWDIAARLGLADTAAIHSALSSSLTVRYRW